MATNTTTKSKTGTTTRKTSTTAAAKAEPAEIKAAPETKPLIPKDVDPSMYVIVRNGFQGRLVYKSKRTGETFVWDEFGGEQEMELRELRNAKNSYKKFFINNWFMFDEPWIIDYLGVRNYYKNAIPIDEFDDIFDLDAKDLKKKVSSLSAGQRRSVEYRAKELIAEKQIDSLRVIEALEEALGIELVEK